MLPLVRLWVPVAEIVPIAHLSDLLQQRFLSGYLNTAAGHIAASLIRKKIACGGSIPCRSTAKIQMA